MEIKYFSSTDTSLPHNNSLVLAMTAAINELVLCKTLQGDMFHARLEELQPNPFFYRYFNGDIEICIELLGQDGDPLGCFSTKNCIVEEGDSHENLIEDILEKYLLQTAYGSPNRPPVDINEFFKILEVMGYNRLSMEKVRIDFW